MPEFNVALLQLAPGDSLSDNLERGLAACRQAKALGAHLAVFPEMWSNGYGHGFALANEPDSYRHPGLWEGESDPMPAASAGFLDTAIQANSAFVCAFADEARTLDMAVAITFLQVWPGGPRNTVILLDRHGRKVLEYAKHNLCAFAQPEASLTAGDAFPVAVLDTPDGVVRVGAMICFDRESPLPARRLMRAGAEVIVVPNACELEANRLGQARARAWENMVGLAIANYAPPGANGHSTAFDPLAFDSNGRSRNPTLLAAPEDEGVYLAAFDLVAIREFRRREVWADVYSTVGQEAAVSIPDFRRVDRGGRPFEPRSDAGPAPERDD